jgi:hypothetical protein
LYARQADGSFSTHKRLTVLYDCDKDEEALDLDDVPLTAVPVDVDIQIQTLKVFTHHKGIQLPPPDPPPPATLLECIETMEPWEKDLFHHFQLEVPLDQFIEALLTRTVYICSDGSARQQTNKSSFAWRMSTADGIRLATCAGPARTYHATS